MPDLIVLEQVTPEVERRGDAVDDRGWRSQLVRGERDEVRLELVGLLKRLPLSRDLGFSFVGEQREAAEAAQKLELLLGEERGVRARPRNDRALAEVETLASGPLGCLVRIDSVGPEQAIIGVQKSDPTRADD